MKETAIRNEENRAQSADFNKQLRTQNQSKLSDSSASNEVFYEANQVQTKPSQLLSRTADAKEKTF